MLHIVLHEPEIPFNTGAIGRTCVATNTKLHLIKPYGFFLDEKAVKRAGMDYWDRLDLEEHLDYDHFLAEHPEIEEGTSRLWYATTKGQQIYSDVTFGENDFIMFGKESAGIPEEILVKHPERCIRLPMGNEIRSLNLSNSVTAILYEALRQNQFPNLTETGELHHLKW